MDVLMNHQEFAACPDRTKLKHSPIVGNYYRDQSWPDDVFRCDSLAPIRWSCFRVTIAREMRHG